MKRKLAFKPLAREERDRLLEQIDQKSSLTVKVSRKDLHAAKEELLSNGVSPEALIGWMLQEISLRRSNAELLIRNGKAFSQKRVSAVNVFDEIERLRDSANQ